MAGELDLKVADEAGQLTVTVGGEVDLDTAPQLRDCLAAHTDADVTVNLADVSFVDSSALAVLVEALQRLRKRGYRLRTVNERETVRRVLEISGLDMVFHDGD